MTDTDWFPGKEADQLLVVQNINSKIGNYAAQLGLTAADVTRIQLLCQTFVDAVTKTYEAQETMEALVKWKNAIKNNATKAGEPAPAAPSFAAVTLPLGATVGVIDQLRAEVRQWKEADGYTEAIGKDLQIVTEKGEQPDPDAIVPEIEVQALSGFRLKVKWKMNGFNLVRVEYQRKGTDVWQPFFLNKSPGEIQIAPALAAQAETGFVRAIYIKDNQDFGIYSDMKTVTLS
jgi:hypothetical protein